MIPPPLIHKLFGYRKFSETQHRSVPLRNFSALWDKKILTENRDAPSLLPSSLLIHKFFRSQKFCETQKGYPTKFFGTARQQIFYRKSWYSPHRHKIFRYPKLMKHWRVPLPTFLALWDKKFSTENLDTLLSLLSLTFFDNRNFLKHRRVPWRNFLALWDENFSRENRDTLLHKVQKSVVELICKNSLETKIKTLGLFLTVCKIWWKILYLGEKYAGASRTSCFNLFHFDISFIMFVLWCSSS